MRISFPITDYIRQSILTTKGDLVVRGDAIPEKLIAAVAGKILTAKGVGVLPEYDDFHLSNVGIKIANNSRNTSGSQVFSGVGFQPSMILLFVVDQLSTNINWSVGFTSEGQCACIAESGSAGTQKLRGASAAWIWRDVDNYMECIGADMGTDGFTLYWSLEGACPCKFVYCCIP